MTHPGWMRRLAATLCMAVAGLCSVATPAAAQTLTSGGPFAGDISIAYEIDRYTFAGTAGETVMLTASRTGTASALHPRLRLQAPGGGELAQDADATVAFVSATLPVSGTYTVLVSDGHNEPRVTGGYHLHFVRGSSANEHGLLGDAAERSGRIDRGDLDSYTFFARAGEHVLLSAAHTSSGDALAPAIVVFGPNGARRRTAFDSLVASMLFVPEATGTHTVVVYDGGHVQPTQEGSYVLRLARAPGANELGLLASGSARDGRIDRGDIDSYTFHAQAGQSVALQLADTSGDGALAPRLLLFDPAGRLRREAFDQTVASTRYTAESTGVYTVLVDDGGHVAPRATGDYRLHFVKVPGAVEHGPLVAGGTRSGTLDVGDLDSYTLVARAGDRVTLSLTDTSADGALAPQVTLYGLNGDVLSYAAGANGGSTSFTLPADGAYTVLVNDGGHVVPSAQGSYQLALAVTGPRRLSYAALGDSYSSGEGVPPYLDRDEGPLSGCHRSTRAYSQLLRRPDSPLSLAQRSDARVDFFACSGAVTDNVRADGEGQHGEPPQMAAGNAVNASRDLVTISIGGNDAQFARIFAFCLVHDDCNGIQPFAPHSDITLGEFAPLLTALTKAKVRDVHSRLRAATPNAATLVLGYPILLSGTECAAARFPTTGDAELKVSASEQAFLREANRQVNTAIAESAAEVGLHFVPVAERFAGHEICGALDPWINGIVFFNPSFNPKASVHPTARGQQEYANAVEAYLQAASGGWPHGYLANGLPRNPPPAAGLLARPAAASGAALPAMGELRVTLPTLATACRGLENVVVPGQAMRLQGSGLVPHEAVQLSLVVAGRRVALGHAAAGAGGALDAQVNVPVDLRPGSVIGIEALGAGPGGTGQLLLALARVEASAGVDSDGDGVPDLCDLCVNTANPGQRDVDGDGYGDACDADFDNSGLVDTLDLARLRADTGQRGDNLVTDLDGNGVVDAQDLALFKALFGKPPGPAQRSLNRAPLSLPQPSKVTR